MNKFKYKMRGTTIVAHGRYDYYHCIDGMHIALHFNTDVQIKNYSTGIVYFTHDSYIPVYEGMSLSKIYEISNDRHRKHTMVDSLICSMFPLSVSNIDKYVPD